MRCGVDCRPASTTVTVISQQSVRPSAASLLTALLEISLASPVLSPVQHRLLDFRPAPAAPAAPAQIKSQCQASHNLTLQYMVIYQLQYFPAQRGGRPPSLAGRRLLDIIETISVYSANLVLALCCQEISLLHNSVAVEFLLY